MAERSRSPAPDSGGAPRPSRRAGDNANASGVNASGESAGSANASGESAKNANASGESASGANASVDGGASRVGGPDGASASGEGARNAGGAGKGENGHRTGDLIANKYRLERLLGEGGMGSVWRAHNEALDVAVAIKVIRRLEGAPEAERRLLQEARAAARLEHPAIVRVFDFGESELGEPFIVMELLYGETLAEHLERLGRLSAAEAVRLLLPVAGGLAAAHAKGVVHRDLKPDNVVLVRRDDGVVSPKIVDFGIAKLPNDELAGTLTALGTVLGSPDYMSPEQAKGLSDVDARSDVWSLAVVLYELTTGTRPFRGPNYNALLSAIMMGEPVPTTDFAAGDAQLWALLRRAFEKDPAQRWPSVREFGQALGAWAAEHGVTTDVSGAALAAHWAPSDPTPEPPLSLDIGPAPSSPTDPRRAPLTLAQAPGGDARARPGRGALWLSLSLVGAAFALAFGRVPAARLLPALTATSTLAPHLPPTTPPAPLVDVPAPRAALASPPGAAPPSTALAPSARAFSASPTAPAPLPRSLPASPSAASAGSPGAPSAPSPSAAASSRRPLPPRGAPPKGSAQTPPSAPDLAPAPETPPPDTLPIPAEPNFLADARPLAPNRISSPPLPSPLRRPPSRRPCRPARRRPAAIAALWLRRGALAAGVAAFVAAPGRARAESPADVAVARELFREGSRHAQRGAWDEARERFERSLALRRAPLTLYSLGVAQKNLGLLVEATESFNAFLAEASVPATRPYEAPARAAIAELDKRLAHVTLQVSPADAEGLRVRIDSEDVPRASLGVPRPLNPGEHFLAVSARGYRPASQAFRLGEGGAHELTLALEPFALPPRDETAIAPPRPLPCPPALAPTGRGAASHALERPSRVGPWLLAAAGAIASAGGLWLSLDAIAADDPLDPLDDRSSRRRELFGHALTTGGLVSFGVGVGLLLALPTASPPAPRATLAPRAAPGLSF